MTDTVIPMEWAESINQNLTCMVLRGALADWYREQGDDLAAEALDWSIDKGRSPTTDGEDYKWSDVYSSTPVACNILPDSLCIHNPKNWYGISTPYDALVRLIGKWKNASPEERAEHWQWEPK